MKKFAQTALVLAGLVGLSACASDADVWKPYGTRTAGDLGEVRYSSNNSDALKVCLERENRLLAMNKACYRK